MNNAIERSEISEHEVKVYRTLKDNPEAWLTHKDISSKSKMNDRTVRAHTLRLVKLGIVDVAELFPQHRYRWSSKGVRRNRAYVQRLDAAADIFGHAVN